MHEIETAVKPILEEMGLYKGNDVSAKDLFEKYLNAFPQGIKTFWKFQVIVIYELNLFVKTSLFDENSEKIYILSLELPKNTVKPKDSDCKAFWLSLCGDRFYSIDDDESLVAHWLYVYERYYDECEDQNNEIYLCRKQHEKIARYWLKHGKHDPAAKNPIVLHNQEIWDQFISKYVCWKSKIDWIGISKKNKVDIKKSFRRWL